ncbi:hypothetical protein BDC45DRAFT_558935 [Circinella umbellata]|nr:hypothetical protein BDC45DRAFT_558935 [Circinella umbellata]
MFSERSCISYAFYTVDAIEEFQQEPFSSIILKEQKYDDIIHTTYWATQFFSPPLLTNTTLLYVTGIISIIVWFSGYMIDYLIERQEQMAMELGKQKQVTCSLYGAI